MNIKTTIIAALVIAVAVMMCGCIDDPNIGEPKTTATRATTTSAAAVPATPEAGTYNDPTPLGMYLVVSGIPCSLGVTNVIRGDEANRYIAQENMFNDAPRSGYEYMFVNIFFLYTGDGSYTVSSWDFKAYANNAECPKTYVVLPDHIIELPSSIELMPEGSTFGYVVFEVPIGSQVTIGWDRMFSKTFYLDAGIGDFQYGEDEV